MKSRLEKSKHQKEEEQKETGRQKSRGLKKGRVIWNPMTKGTYSPHSDRETRRNQLCDTSNRKFNKKKKEKK
jgi:hypothetical protein